MNLYYIWYDDMGLVAKTLLKNTSLRWIPAKQDLKPLAVFMLNNIWYLQFFSTLHLRTYSLSHLYTKDYFFKVKPGLFPRITREATASKRCLDGPYSTRR